jgi:hypothetical protein
MRIWKIWTYVHSIAQLKTFVSTLARRSIIGLKRAVAVFSHVFAALYLLTANLIRGQILIRVDDDCFLRLCLVLRRS